MEPPYRIPRFFVWFVVIVIIIYYRKRFRKTFYYGNLIAVGLTFKFKNIF